MADTRKTFRFKVYSPPHTKFAAIHLVEQIKKLGHYAVLTDFIGRNDPFIYILYNATTVKTLPRRYIVYQTEIHGTHFFNSRYAKIIKGAMAVWDYCSENLGSYSHSNVSIVTPGISQQHGVIRDIDFLFYGWMKGSRRREVIVKKLQKQVRLTVVTNKLCADIWEILKRTKTVINVHYYDHSPLEIFRINEALSFGCGVISEGYSERYSDSVTFRHYSEIVEEAVIQKKKFAQKTADLSKLDNLLEVQAAITKL